jgi:hyperosmotically inducible periplasmic protein
MTNKAAMLLGALLLAGCAGTAASPDVSGQIRKSLDSSGLGDVSVSQDRAKGVVTLGGKVQSDGQRSQSDSIAKSVAGAQVVADEIAVLPPDAEKPATVNADLDKAIGENLDAALIQNHFDRDVHHDVKNGVITLSGTVNSQGARDQVARVANTVPDVRQVVNELQIKDQKASSSSPH